MANPTWQVVKRDDGKTEIYIKGRGAIYGPWQVADIIRELLGEDLVREIEEALAGDSNDAEHDALAAVAEALRHRRGAEE